MSATRLEWIILLVSVATDFVITVGTALGTTMAESKTGLPSYGAFLAAFIGGVVVASRTVQGGLKAMLTRLYGQPAKVEEPKPPTPTRGG